MFRTSPLTTRVLLAVVALAAITLLRFKPWQEGAKPAGGHRETLSVGFLPVT